MPRKIKIIKLEVDEARKKVQELEAMADLAAQEEQALIETTKQQIQALADQAGFYCGIILDPTLLITVIDLALKSHENVKIPFNLYYKE